MDLKPVVQAMAPVAAMVQEPVVVTALKPAFREIRLDMEIPEEMFIHSMVERSLVNSLHPITTEM